MANNYQLWSASFAWPTQRKEEAQRWLAAATADPPEDNEDGPTDYKLLPNQENWRDFENCEGRVDFQVNLNDDNAFVVYVDDSGNLEHAVALVQEYFREFDPEAIGTIEWADTCDKPRPGEFGGGVVVFDKDHEYWRSTGALSSELREQLLQARRGE